MTQPTEFRLSKAILDPISDCATNQKGTAVRVMRVTGKRSITYISFQKFGSRWVPFKRQTVSTN
jgi:hypothetical protein